MTNQTKTLKQSLANNSIYLSEEILTRIEKAVKEYNTEWLTQKPTIPKILCNQLCHNACKICLLDDALSRTELLQELNQK